MPKQSLIAFVVALLAVTAAPSGGRSESNVLVCTLQRSGSEFKGSCDVPCQVNALAVDVDGVTPGFTCNEPPRPVTASLRKAEKGDNWIGDMQVSQEYLPLFEIVTDPRGGAGVAKIPFGWFPLQSPRLDGDTLALTISVEKQLPPTRDDIRIINRSIELLADVNTWNKNDNRTCPVNPHRWSMFCALMQATEEVSGGVHYRQPALQAVREVLNEVGGNRVSKHRLMDYNNHPDTTLEDVHNLLRTAQARLEGRFR